MDSDSMDWIAVKNNWLNKTFSIKKVKAAFRHMGSYKSAGPDGIKLVVMKHFGPRALFRKFRVVFIPKPQKDDYWEAGSFRPISLTPFLFKTMEHIVEWSLRENFLQVWQLCPH